MKMYIIPEDRGQIVETSYGWSDGVAYMRLYDRSDGTTQWYRGDVDWDLEDEEGVDYDRPPYIIGDWILCDQSSAVFVRVELA